MTSELMTTGGIYNPEDNVWIELLVKVVTVNKSQQSKKSKAIPVTAVEA
jgi:hypothetical protein